MDTICKTLLNQLEPHSPTIGAPLQSVLLITLYLSACYMLGMKFGALAYALAPQVLVPRKPYLPLLLTLAASE